MEFVAGLFAGIAFWPFMVFLVASIFLIGCSEYESPGYGLLVALIAVGIISYLHGSNPLVWLYEHPFKFITYALLYVGAGVAYSFFRWDWLVSRWRAEYDEATDNYKKRSLWLDKPEAKKSKRRLITWMAYWPWSAFWFFLADFIQEMFTRIYRKLGKFYDMVTERHMHGIVAPVDQDDQPDGPRENKRVM